MILLCQSAAEKILHVLKSRGMDYYRSVLDEKIEILRFLLGVITMTGGGRVFSVRQSIFWNWMILKQYWNRYREPWKKTTR